MVYSLTRREFAKAVLASAVTLAGNPISKNLETLASEAPETFLTPSLNNFKKILKGRKTEPVYLECLWEQMTGQEKKLTILAYANEKEFLKAIPESTKNKYLPYTNLSEKLSAEELKVAESIYTEKYPWINFRNLSDADKWILYLDCKKAEEFREMNPEQRKEYYEKLRRNHGIKVQEPERYPEESQQKPRSKYTKEEKIKEIERIKERFQSRPRGLKGLYQEIENFLYQ